MPHRKPPWRREEKRNFDSPWYLLIPLGTLLKFFPRKQIWKTKRPRKIRIGPLNSLFPVQTTPQGSTAPSQPYLRFPGYHPTASRGGSLSSHPGHFQAFPLCLQKPTTRQVDPTFRNQEARLPLTLRSLIDGKFTRFNTQLFPELQCVRPFASISRHEVDHVAPLDHPRKKACFPMNWPILAIKESWANWKGVRTGSKKFWPILRPRYFFKLWARPLNSWVTAFRKLNRVPARPGLLLLKAALKS